MSRVVLEGFDELVQALTEAPETIRKQGLDIIRQQTEQAAAEIRAKYQTHSKTGTLARRVRTSFPSTTILVGIVQSTAPHSHLFEFGTKNRRTDQGWNRGRMPDDPVTPKIAQKHRTVMFAKLQDMLRGLGFQVGS